MPASFGDRLAATRATIRRSLKLEGIWAKHKTKVVHHVEFCVALPGVKTIVEHVGSTTTIEHRREEHAALLMLMLMMGLMLLKSLFL